MFFARAAIFLAPGENARVYCGFDAKKMRGCGSIAGMKRQIRMACASWRRQPAAAQTMLKDDVVRSQSLLQPPTLFDTIGTARNCTRITRKTKAIGGMETWRLHRGEHREDVVLRDTRCILPPLVWRPIKTAQSASNANASMSTVAADTLAAVGRGGGLVTAGVSGGGTGATHTIGGFSVGVDTRDDAVDGTGTTRSSNSVSGSRVIARRSARARPADQRWPADPHQSPQVCRRSSSTAPAAIAALSLLLCRCVVVVVERAGRGVGAASPA